MQPIDPTAVTSWTSSPFVEPWISTSALIVLAVLLILLVISSTATPRREPK